MNLKRIILLISTSSLLVLAACDQTTIVDTTAIAAQVITAIAQTVEAMPSATPEPTATETPTATPTETPTQTPSPTASLTSSPIPLNVYGVVNSTPQSNTCDNVVFVKDVTIPDGTVFTPGAAFTKSWQLKNTGTCTWNAEYAIKFSSGNNMSGVSPQKLVGKPVAPGQSVDISINLVAPTQAGSYTGYWQMQNASKVAFGQAFYVEIKVATVTSTPTATPTTTTIPPTATTASTATDTPVPTETATETPLTP